MRVIWDLLYLGVTHGWGWVAFAVGLPVAVLLVYTKVTQGRIIDRPTTKTQQDWDRFMRR